MNSRTIRYAALALATALAGVLAGCVSTTSRVATATQIDTALAGAHRSPANRARDTYRHPRQTLLFFGIRPEMTVVEMDPGAGWYTEVLAPLLRDKGRLLVALTPADPANANAGATRGYARFQAFLGQNPQVFDKVELVPMAPGKQPIAPPGTADMVLTFRSIHGWMEGDVDIAPAAFADMYKALKPGGVLGVVEHRGVATVPQDPKAKSGYVNQAYAIKLIEGTGFRLVATSEINANPKDTKDYPGGVWTLPPSLQEGDKDRARYLAIGESDRFTLKFIKPRN
ncbi:MAG TPA: hypothetical protein VGO41_06020 [Steroidobacteraceae bacterium]|jgi:predicted methyltransferase|nr:hypothetical protein [Steroidobacteraceae bacterium]